MPVRNHTFCGKNNISWLVTTYNTLTRVLGVFKVTFGYLKQTFNPLQYSCWENPMDRGAWRATVHGVAKSQT